MMIKYKDRSDERLERGERRRYHIRRPKQNQEVVNKETKNVLVLDGLAAK